MQKLSAIALLGLLAACSTPQQTCPNGAAAEVRALNARIATVAANIDRGYAVHRSNSPRVGITTCSGSRNFRICQKLNDGPRETPVVIDVAEEKRKLAQLQIRLADARSRAAAMDAQCPVLYPG